MIVIENPIMFICSCVCTASVLMWQKLCSHVLMFIVFVIQQGWSASSVIVYSRKLD
jgi:hypothetical protein